MPKRIDVKCTGADTLPIDELVIIQGDFKTLSKLSAEKLKTSILKEGFSDPVRVWVSGGEKKQYNVIDGTQRVTVLLQMRDEGYEIPPLPVDYIEASSRKDAIKKLIALSSQYGDIDIKGFDILLDDAQIVINDIVDFSRLMKGGEIEMIEPTFLPVSEDEQGRLDKNDASTIICPHCGKEIELPS